MENRFDMTYGDMGAMWEVKGLAVYAGSIIGDMNTCTDTYFEDGSKVQKHIFISYFYYQKLIIY